MVSSRAVKEALKGLGNCVTIKYPFGPPAHLPEGFRGKIQIDKEKCMGCGACAMLCPSSADTAIDGPEFRTIRIMFGRCVFCATCQEVCPPEALKLTKEFDLTTYKLEEASVSNDIPWAKCANCGHVLSPSPQLDWGIKSVLEKIDPSVKATVEEDAKKYLHLCEDCRIKVAAKLNFHTRKYV